ncbi:hypothetical protein F8388_023727 [Cannabis sativa]|uniref:Uncharacterized protein n=1 Tax=Cannabis sativa TaxID=3483 RepID=A0A7J6H0F9_CANSA|nr:hypothetical protein F8388_023727 [Cannabis sativa]KAF4388653.1 hypothetical protein G4B88_018930 [Cannabis sativa]
MRDIVSCFSENSVTVSNPLSSSSCSNYSTASTCITTTPASSIPSIQNAVVLIHRVILSNPPKKHIIVKTTWCRNNSVQGLTVSFGEDPLATMKLNINSRLFRKKKGSKIFDSHGSKIELYWDLSNSKFENGPEPIEGFYLVATFDSEIGLILGDLGEDFVSKKLKNKTQMAKTSLISRHEHCSGNTLYSTKAQFSETGVSHEVLIKCSGEHPVLVVSIDKKVVIRVKRLQWNFRGNQTIFVDGLLVDLLWDVHDWFFNSSSSSSSGFAVFMFRTRSGLDSRLWLEEKLMATQNKDLQEKLEFSLLIYACKSKTS